MNVKIFKKSQELEARAFVAQMASEGRLDTVTVDFTQLTVYYLA